MLKLDALQNCRVEGMSANGGNMGLWSCGILVLFALQVCCSVSHSRNGWSCAHSSLNFM